MKKTYIAHAIFFFDLLFRENDTFLVHENIYIICAENARDAFGLATAEAKKHEELSEAGNLEVNGEKCAYVFSGIRKITEIKESIDKYMIFQHISGEEATYSIFEVDDADKVMALAAGCDVDGVLYRE